jgi:hypothetical protein
MQLRYHIERTIAILTILFVLIGVVNSARANPKPTAKPKQLIYTGYRQGVSWQVFLLNTRSAGQLKVNEEIRKLYLVDLETVLNKTKYKFTDLVQCSTTYPFVASRDELSNPKITNVNSLNPGGDISGYNFSNHMLYWTVCHNLKDAQRYEPEELKFKAERLGYTTVLENADLEIPNWDYEKLKP